MKNPSPCTHISVFTSGLVYSTRDLLQNTALYAKEMLKLCIMNRKLSKGHKATCDTEASVGWGPQTWLHKTGFLWNLDHIVTLGVHFSWHIYHWQYRKLLCCWVKKTKQTTIVSDLILYKLSYPRWTFGVNSLSLVIYLKSSPPK